MQTAATIAFVGLVIFLAHYLAGVFSRTRVPDVLWLFVLGLIIGPGLELVSPASLGEAGPIFTTITLVFILFESGTDLRLDSIRRSLGGALSLTTANFVVSTALIVAIAVSTTSLGLLPALVLGSILGGTSSAAVAGLVRHLRIRAESAAILVVESAFSDVFTLAIPLALMAALQLQAISVGETVGRLIAALSLALLLGIASGFTWSILLTRVRTLANSIFTTPAFVFVVYGAVEMLGYSGPIAALAFGITIGNIEALRPPILARYIRAEPVALNEIEKIFFAEVVFLLRTFFFLYIGVSVSIDRLDLIALGLAMSAALTLARIPVVRLTLPRRTPASDAAMMSVLIPKGLGAAVLASIPLQRGIEGGETIQTLTFAVILGTTVFGTVLIYLIERTPVARFYRFCFSGFAPDDPVMTAAPDSDVAGSVTGLDSDAERGR